MDEARSLLDSGIRFALPIAGLSVVLLVAAGCESGVFVEFPSVPEDIDFLGAYYRGPRAEASWNGTRLAPRAQIQSLELEVESFSEQEEAVLALVGFREDTLGPNFRPDDQVGVLSPTEAECLAPLPAPDFHLDVRGQGSLEAALSVPGLDRLCDHASGALPVQVEIRCGIISCAAERVTSDGCAFSIEASSCGLPPLSGHRLPRQRVCLNAQIDATCHEHQGDTDALFDLDCELTERTCRVRAFPAEESKLQVERYQPFGEVPDFSHAGVGRLPLSADQLRTGYVTDIALLDGRLFAAWQGGQRVGPTLPSTLQATELWRFEADTMAHVGTTTIAPTARLAIAGETPALYGLGISDGEFVVRKFDASGREFVRWRVGLPALDASRQAAYIPFDLVGVPRTNLVVAVLRARSPGPADHVVALDATSGAIVQDLELSVGGVEPKGVVAVAASARGELGLALDTTKTVDFVDFVTRSQRAIPINPDGLTLSSSAYLMALFLDAVGSDFLLGIAGGAAGISRWEAAAFSGRAPWFDSNADFNSFSTEPDAAGRILVTGAEGRGTSERLTAVAADYDLVAQRFRTGTVELGVGVAARVLTSARGELVLLPWSATIVRVSRGPM